MVLPVQLWRIELSRHDWASLSCGCGRTAWHVPEDFARYMEAAPAQAAEYSSPDGLDGHVIIQSNIFESAIPAANVLLAALSSDCSIEQSRRLVSRLCGLISAETHHSEVAAGRADLESRVRGVAREGIWVLYRELVEHASVSALFALEYIESDEERLDRHYRAVRHRLPGVAGSDDYELFARRDLGY